jgi:phage-related protein
MTDFEAQVKTAAEKAVLDFISSCGGWRGITWKP